MIPRAGYLDFLRQFRNKQLIKVVSGVRRCGKSTLLKQVEAEIMASETGPKRIISANFEDLAFADIRTAKNLHDHVCGQLLPEGMNYVFLDEVQLVSEFEKAVDSLFLRPNVDLYMTGSNACFLSGELATRLSGRYVETRMLPLSFAEYCSAMPPGQGMAQIYGKYLQTSFPYCLELGENENAVREYLNGIYNTVLLKDIVQRTGTSDVGKLESVIRFVFDSIGSQISAKKIADRLTSAGRKTDPKTVDKYLRGLCDAFILYEAKRYDIKGGQYLTTLPKYYLVDMGLRRLLLGQRGGDAGHELENVIYLELLRRGHDVRVGQTADSEIDFVAKKAGQTSYYQVALTALDQSILERELTPLRKIRDNYDKYLLTLDEIEAEADFNGIKKKNALRWLLEAQAV